MKAALIYPHQLFPQHPALAGADVVFLVEDPLFFRQYHFHKQKLILHRASMKQFAGELTALRYEVRYVDAHELDKTESIGKLLRKLKISHAQFVALNDDWLTQRVTAALQQAKIDYRQLDDPHFLTNEDEINQFSETAGSKKKGWYFTDFYIAQRKRLGILLDRSGKPVGGKWSFDTDNRKKLPKDIVLPKISWPKENSHVKEARQYVEQKFPHSFGSADRFLYPVDRAAALKTINDFLDHRLEKFGDYEDAIDAQQSFLFHSVLTPALNIGLISPLEVAQTALDRVDRVPMNSLEGFVRQVIGWREYIRAVYLMLGRKQRCRNYWSHARTMPASFYDGTTGIEPVDIVIRRVLETGYCHHIERLMILGNMMLLCEIDPDAIYQWFMELFIDAYDWVMVPNVYGMSQYADGGLITTKPYISGSAYVLKMSNFKKGAWCPIWDGLYWRFIDKHRDFFASNPRMSVMVKQCERMGSKLTQHHSNAEKFYDQLWG